MPNLLRPTLIAASIGLSALLANPALAEEAPATTAPAAEETAPAADAATPPADAPATERAPLEERSVEAASGLERQLPQDEQQQLKAGDETFLALWKPANVGEPTGVVILVPASGESADWPQAIGPLRSKLPDAGWSSLSLTLPDLPQLAPAVAPVTVDTATPPSAPADAAATDNQEAADSASADAAADDSTQPATPDSSATAPIPVVDPAPRIFARIQAAIAFAEQQQAKAIVLLGHGDGAYWAARFIAEQKPPLVQHLLVAAPALPEGMTPPLEELLPELQLPTGDFFYKDQSSDRSAATRRLHASKRLQHKAYTQVALKALPGNPSAEQEQLYRRIRGWLDKALPAKK
ncbi:alpha/beta hydrolase family protein [Pseudomonas sp. J452]|uniref:alpha/beta hydrolase family protein n=1 Tax=Pseudomonas sp. J452 TaxID=2898441 RepID=UPI0021AD669A|nr:alpha/beta hydrolase family protein [Pseudomonas sp. J452]UUY08965.1 alpha/beta hydrolase family protein [Pseudomonas sp. J452]